ncbi:hypothetical protein L9F63_022196, partial [Diploptera punctata]
RSYLTTDIMKGQVMWLVLLLTLVQLLHAAPVDESTALPTVKLLTRRQTSEGDAAPEVPPPGETLNITPTEEIDEDSKQESEEESKEEIEDDSKGLYDERRKRAVDSYSVSLVENTDSIDDVRSKVKRQIEENYADGESSEEFGEILPLVRTRRRAQEKSLESNESTEDADESTDGVTTEKIARRQTEDSSSEESDEVPDDKKRRDTEDSSSDESDETTEASDKRKRREDGTTSTAGTTSTTEVPVIVIAPSDVPVKQISAAIKEDLDNLREKVDQFESKVEAGEPTIASVGVIAGQETAQDKDT